MKFFKYKDFTITKILLHLLFFILIYKMKYLYIIISDKCYFIYSLLFLNANAIYYPYGICLSKIEWSDILLVHNIFFTYFICLNILVLIYMNNNSFNFKRDEKTFFDSFKKNPFYYFSLTIIILITIFSISTEQDIKTFWVLKSFTEETFKKEDLLVPFYYRLVLLSFYKILIIYLAFCRKDISTFYRLSIWFVFGVFLRFILISSGLIVDTSFCFILLNSCLECSAILNSQMYFDFLCAYCAPIKNTLVRSASSALEIISENKEEIEKKRIHSCQKYKEAAANCVYLQENFRASIKKYEPWGDLTTDHEHKVKIAECSIFEMKLYEKCMNNKFTPTPTSNPEESKTLVLDHKPINIDPNLVKNSDNKILNVNVNHNTIASNQINSSENLSPPVKIEKVFTLLPGRDTVSESIHNYLYDSETPESKKKVQEMIRLIKKR